MASTVVVNISHIQSKELNKSEVLNKVFECV